MAVLFADIEGCTRLCEDLAPLAMERVMRADAARALSAALGIVEAAQALNAARRRRHDPIIVNIGINAGEALVGTTRLRGHSSERGVYSATGPVTNVAARLCALATRGQILVTGAVAQMLDDAYPARRLGRRRLKNVSAPVEVFEIKRSRFALEERKPKD